MKISNISENYINLIDDKQDCYNLRLGLDCNLGKDLSKSIGISQLVKHKDTELYLQLYITIDNEVKTCQTYVYNIMEHEKNKRKQCLLYEVLTKTIVV